MKAILKSLLLSFLFVLPLAATDTRSIEIKFRPSRTNDVKKFMLRCTGLKRCCGFEDDKFLACFEFDDPLGLGTSGILSHFGYNILAILEPLEPGETSKKPRKCTFLVQAFGATPRNWTNTKTRWYKLEGPEDHEFCFTPSQLQNGEAAKIELNSFLEFVGVTVNSTLLKATKKVVTQGSEQLTTEQVDLFKLIESLCSRDPAKKPHAD